MLLSFMFEFCFLSILKIFFSLRFQMKILLQHFVELFCYFSQTSNVQALKLKQLVNILRNLLEVLHHKKEIGLLS